MKKEEIYVLIDSEQKRLRAIQILEGAGEQIWKRSIIFEGSIKNSGYLYYDPEFNWSFGSVKETHTEITLDQLEELLMLKKSTHELTFPREMFVWNEDEIGAKKKMVHGFFKGQPLVDTGDGTYCTFLNAEDLPTFETEVSKLAKQFGVKVIELKYEYKK